MKHIILLFLATSTAFAIVGNLTGSIGSIAWAAVFATLSTLGILAQTHKRGGATPQ